ncbi:hypothetical protein [Pelistega suis]|uniref:Uncharacterized protein n=1 Tax=Pelistega suis TaxID=1631957 RepID=A0A849P456_9BURK|nr:hypothetical protein [Pelistega suis]NOL52449.1 hypothetical protein [Pelistega suis]
MSKRATNIVLLLVSISIILFIVNAFYSAFTREHRVPSNEPTPSSTVSGEITGTTPVPPPSTTESTPSTIPTENIPDTQTTESTNEEAGKVLEENPTLREALPPVPEAPAATESTTSSSSTRRFRPINSNDEAIPLNNGNVRNNDGANSNFPTPSSGNSRFPTPSNSGNSNFPTPSQGSNNSFPAPIN